MTDPLSDRYVSSSHSASLDQLVDLQERRICFVGIFDGIRRVALSHRYLRRGPPLTGQDAIADIMKEVFDDVGLVARSSRRHSREGRRVRFDETNFAPQAVLEGSNAILGHRATVYIPYLAVLSLNIPLSGSSRLRTLSFRAADAKDPQSLFGCACSPGNRLKDTIHVNPHMRMN
ncbi:hypothetical protein FPV67DRAFT_1455651 [Lyophyllum atratum]|nr:hypothetical protein FPV67DRAFT_1455651 [Lyophyllum atratum]